MFDYFNNKEIQIATEMLKASASSDFYKAQAAMEQLVKAFNPVVRKGVLACDIVKDIFAAIPIEPGMPARFPVDFLQPGTESDYSAYTVAGCGYIPQRTVEGDYVDVPYYKVANSIDWCIDYAENARWDVVSSALDRYRRGFDKKLNDDGWHVILAAGYGRGIIAVDSAASSGYLSKRLISAMKVTMRRNGGGNSTCVDRGQLTDLYLSPEAMEDMRNWNLDEIDDVSRRELMNAGDCDGGSVRVFCVNFHPLDELGEGQEYQTFYETQLGQNDVNNGMPAGKVELVVGLDLRERQSSFVMPVRTPLRTFNDPNLVRQQKQGVFGWMQIGFGALDSRKVLLGAL